MNVIKIILNFKINSGSISYTEKRLLAHFPARIMLFCRNYSGSDGSGFGVQGRYGSVSTVGEFERPSKTLSSEH